MRVVPTDEIIGEKTIKRTTGKKLEDYLQAIMKAAIFYRREQKYVTMEL